MLVHVVLSVFMRAVGTRRVTRARVRVCAPQQAHELWNRRTVVAKRFLEFHEKMGDPELHKKLVAAVPKGE